MQSFSGRIEAIRKDRSHGASELTRQALEIMRDAVRASIAANPLEFLEEMREVAEELIKARTTMVSIRNLVSRFIYLLITPCAESEANSEGLKNWSVQALSNLIEIVLAARKKVILNAAGFIPAGTRLITCSYSSTVIEVLRQIAAGGRPFNIMVLESPSGGNKYGEMTAAQLAAKGIASTVIAAEQMISILSQADMILIGADAVLADGSVVNGCPSLALARAAAANVPPLPVYSVCESIKFYPGNSFPPVEEGFELIPAHLIKGIITESNVPCEPEPLMPEGHNHL